KGKTLARKVKHVTIEALRPGSGSATTVATRTLGPQALVQAREDAQKRVNEAMKGLGGRTIEQIRNAHAASTAAHTTEPDPSYLELQDAGDAMDIDDWEDLDNEDSAGNVLHALRDFMAEQYVRAMYDLF
ncbi:hypothetical protein C2E23DRAFT_707543, partial [Lenzites betulinus]